MVVTLLAFAASASTLPGAANVRPELPPAAEIISVLKSNYVDRDQLSDQLLNTATIDGILQALGCGAEIVPIAPAATNAAAGAAVQSKPVEPLAHAEVIDPAIGYIRLADVTAGVVTPLDGELKNFAQKKVTGLVLDLRFADGTNYAAAAAVASRFLGGDQELFTLKSAETGPQVFHTGGAAAAPSAGPDLTSVPLILLVNAETRGSAEALAGGLRAQDRGIIIGTNTAGAAVEWKDVKLSGGQTLRVATAKIVLPPKTAAAAVGTDIFPGGITPDVMVKIDPKVEREVVLAVHTNETLTASLQPRVEKKGLSEAELVKAFRGQAVDTSTVSTNKAAEEEGDIQNVRDVVLQRAVDILKGIRVLLSWQ